MTKSAAQNSRYIGGLWLFAIVLGVPILVATGALAAQGNFGMLVILAGTAAFVAFIFRRTAKRIERLLRTSASPDPLVAFYRKAFRAAKMPDVDAHLAFSSALAYLIYGDGMRAEFELSRLDWSERPPLITAMRDAARALNCYLISRDFSAGLGHAKRAANLARTSANFPGVKTAEAAYGSYVDIGLILTSGPDPRLLDSLKSRAEQLPLLGRLICWWGLATGYRLLGDSAAGDYERHIREHAPHCGPLVHARQTP